MSVAKTAERERARKLRREEGRSVKELAALLGVSRSSISLWVRDIELTEEQHQALRRRMGGRIDGSRVNAVRALERRRSAQEAGRKRARRNQPLHIAGCMLFWAEDPERATGLQERIERFWLDLLGLPRTCLQRSTVNRFSSYSKKKRKNKLPNGTCSLGVWDTQLVHNLYGAIQEYGGFDREEWLM